MRHSISPETKAGIFAGGLSGVAGGLLFATLHAMIIVPIWDRMTSGLVWGALAGAGAGWALAECYPAVIRARSANGIAKGALFGALLWLSIAPVTAVDALLRALGIGSDNELLIVPVAVVLAAAGGATLAWLITNRRRAAVAGGVAGLLLVIAMAGPVPVGRSMRAVNIFLAVLPAAVLGGIVVALFSPPIYRKLLSGRTPEYP